MNDIPDVELDRLRAAINTMNSALRGLADAGYVVTVTSVLVAPDPDDLDGGYPMVWCGVAPPLQDFEL